MKTFATAIELSEMFGFSPEYYRRIAREGKLPPELFNSSHGGHKMYNVDGVRKWLLNNSRKQTLAPRMEHNNVL